MENLHEELQQERKYLEKTIAILQQELEAQEERTHRRRRRVVEAGKDMWENSNHYSTDFEKMTEVSQHLSEVSSQTAAYTYTRKRLEVFQRMMDSPYFARFDFREDGYPDVEKIYIGHGSLVDSRTNDIIVYDWRAPICSIFYRYELGRGVYHAPSGEIAGDVLLKRQYKIRNATLQYFFDCSIRINDEILQEVLGRNASAKMKSIVETIQKEQDRIIRDMDNDLLIVQGVAGSGKTSVALHRIAFLLYEGHHSNISSQNILIISPNSIFTQYVSSVLPELGEENVEQRTFENLVKRLLPSTLSMETGKERFETLLTMAEGEAEVRRMSMGLKGSRSFARILDRLIRYYEHHLIDFQDVYYDGKIIKTRQQLKNEFLHDEIGRPAAKRLKRMETVLFDKIHPMQRLRVKKIEKLVQKMPGHEFDIKPFSRWLSIKESGALLRRIRRFTQVDVYELYCKLFKSKGLFDSLAKGLELPDYTDRVLEWTSKNLEKGFLPYEDAAPFLYLKLKLEGSDIFSEIRHVVIDEAQDYTAMQYEVFHLLFRRARCTIFGDVRQSIDRDVSVGLYDNIIDIYHNRKAMKYFLEKSYRSSCEISSFAKNILGNRQAYISFERHEEEPEILFEDSVDAMDRRMIQDAAGLMEAGFETLAIICRTAKQSMELYDRIKGEAKVRLVVSDDEEISKGLHIIPAYMAKGLEFDAVLVYNVSKENYCSEMDRRLLYVACTRALHRLKLYYTSEKSPFLK